MPAESEVARSRSGSVGGNGSAFPNRRGSLGTRPLVLWLPSGIAAQRPGVVGAGGAGDLRASLVAAGGVGVDGENRTAERGDLGACGRSWWGGGVPIGERGARPDDGFPEELGIAVPAWNHRPARTMCRPRVRLIGSRRRNSMRVAAVGCGGGGSTGLGSG